MILVFLSCVYIAWTCLVFFVDGFPSLYIYISISSILEHGLLLQVSPSLLVTLVCVCFFRFWEIHDLNVLLISQETIIKKLWKVERMNNGIRQGFWERRHKYECHWRNLLHTKRHLETWHEYHQWILLCTKKDSFVVHGFSFTLSKVSPQGQLDLSIVRHY